MIMRQARLDAILSTLVSVHSREVSSLLRSCSFFFFILSAYFLVLPLRDEGPITLGLSNLPALFIGSLALTLIAAPLSTLIFSFPNFSKSKALLLINRFFSVSLVVFFILWRSSSGGALISPFKTKGTVSISTEFKEDQNAGVNQTDSSVYLGSWVLLLFAALLMELAAQSSKGIKKDMSQLPEELAPIRVADPEHESKADEQTPESLKVISPKSPNSRLKPDLSAIVDGFWLVLSSTYLLYVSLFLWLSAVVSLFFYFQGRILTIAGVTAAICSAPVVAFSNLVAIAVWPTWVAVAICDTLRKLVTYVVTRPGRELLLLFLRKRNTKQRCA